MQIEITRLTADDAALLDHVADDVFDAPVDPAASPPIWPSPTT